MSVSLKPLIEQFDDTIDEIRRVDIGPMEEIERSRAIKTLEGAKEVCRALCLSDDPDSDFPVFTLPE